MSNEVFSTHHMSAICGVTMPTVINWIKQGKLPAYKTLGGHRRIKKNDAIEFLKKNKFPLPDELVKEWGCRILIVDDDKTIITLLTRLIKKNHVDCIVGSAMDGYEAGRQILSFKPDLVILDLRLPGVDGFEICRKMKSDPQTGHIKILAITGYHTEETKKKILICGADAYLPKPFDNEEIIEHIRKMSTN
jgi:excisionase family DNA binding protein